MLALGLLEGLGVPHQMAGNLLAIGAYASKQAFVPCLARLGVGSWQRDRAIHSHSRVPVSLSSQPSGCRMYWRSGRLMMAVLRLFDGDCLEVF